jgi:5-oxoprolinase (ATP-hydrolysing)
VLVGGRQRVVPIYNRDSLGAGARVRGPIVVVELSSTAYVAPEFTLRVDDFGNLQLEAAR